METYIIVITAFSFVTILLCFGFASYVVLLVLGGIKTSVQNDLGDVFTPLSEAPLDKVNEFMASRTGTTGFSDIKTLDLNREVQGNEQENPATSPVDGFETDPGENAVM